MKWNIAYWADRNDKSPLEKWLDKLSREQLKSVAKEMALLECCGNQLRLPHSRALGHGLFELRERAYGLRIYYAFLSDTTIVLLHAGDKASQKRDIAIAYTRLSKINEEGNIK